MRCDDALKYDLYLKIFTFVSKGGNLDVSPIMRRACLVIKGIGLLTSEKEWLLLMWVSGGVYDAPLYLLQRLFFV